jgi:exopolysaccharide biosynthesis WecB/TagA/CpsF family protein
MAAPDAARDEVLPLPRTSAEIHDAVATAPAAPVRQRDALPEQVALPQLPAHLLELGAVGRLAGRLLQNLDSGTGGTVTWLNHYSALRSLHADVPLEEFDYLGLDGIFLCRLVRTDAPRTSADLLLPVLLERSRSIRIALVGSTPETLAAVTAKIEAEYGHRVVLARDGYAGLHEPAELRRELQRAGAELVVVGLGAPIQDFWALQLRTPGMLVVTCGGWLDQFTAEAYYPSWAYPLRLNWLVRLAREPRRLWRRYTVDAVRALWNRSALIDFVTGRGARPLLAATAEPDAPAGLAVA